MSDESDKVSEQAQKANTPIESGKLLISQYEKGADVLVLGNFIMLAVALVGILIGSFVPLKVYFFQLPINLVIYLALPKRIELFIYTFIIHILFVFFIALWAFYFGFS